MTQIECSRQPIPADVIPLLPPYGKLQFVVYCNHVTTPERPWYGASQHHKEKTALEAAKYFIRNERRRWFLVIDTATMEMITE